MQGTFPTVVMGDLHGRRDLLLRALVELGLADESGQWTGGSRRLIQLGDVIDRGPEPLGAMDLLMGLQAGARAVGGDLICLLGNHEMMALRAAAGEHASRLTWALNGAASGYREWMDREGLTGDETELPYPDAFFGLFSYDSPYGRWIRSHQVAAQAGGYVVVHAGWTP
ncbi:MAG TPA: metallophosphoesterase, partial [Symbiobacteriaceae bacterium]|nr:metallophosphoesterase [Symbiobacteriaceae bacterium]